MTHAHPTPWRALEAHDRGTLSPDRAVVVERHIRGCGACRQALAEIGALRRVVDEAREEAPPAIEWERIAGAIAAERAEHTRKQASAHRVAGSFAIAAALLLAVFAGRPIEPSGLSSRARHASPAPAARDEGRALVTAVAGFVLGAAEGAPASPVSAGTELTARGRIETFGGALVHLRLAEETGVALDSEGELRLVSLDPRDVKVELGRGTVHCDVKTGTPFAVLAGPYEVRARGTRFSVRWDGRDLAVVMAEGVVDLVGARGQVLRSLTPSAGEAPEARVRSVHGIPTGGDVAPLRLDVQGTVAWSVGDVAFATGGPLAMLAPVEPLDVTMTFADGTFRTTRIDMLPEGAEVREASPEDASPEARHGHLAPEAIATVVREHQGELRRCYEQTLRRRPDFGGGVVLRVVVGESGRVQQTRGVQADEGIDPGFVACVGAQVRAWIFPRPEGGPVTFELPVGLRARTR